ncbi:MAG TPA: hypothetical protein VGT03_08400 [Candidatus Acidoferrales bacterium]|nr:hypothetical protein [Candidatus Acidoferrales bacterium]
MDSSRACGDGDIEAVIHDNFRCARYGSRRATREIEELSCGHVLLANLNPINARGTRAFYQLQERVVLNRRAQELAVGDVAEKHAQVAG